jgi:hypothetical protein
MASTSLSSVRTTSLITIGFLVYTFAVAFYFAILKVIPEYVNYEIEIALSWFCVGGIGILLLFNLVLLRNIEHDVVPYQLDLVVLLLHLYCAVFDGLAFRNDRSGTEVLQIIDITMQTCAIFCSIRALCLHYIENKNSMVVSLPETHSNRPQNIVIIPPISSDQIVIIQQHQPVTIYTEKECSICRAEFSVDNNENSSSTINSPSNSPVNINANNTSTSLENTNVINKEKQTLQCGHVFHKKCIVDWSAYKYRTTGTIMNTCPICRKQYEISINIS